MKSKKSTKTKVKTVKAKPGKVAKKTTTKK
jgi:hypothetical protein